MDVQERLKELDLVVPEYVKGNPLLLPAKCVGNVIYSSGNTATENGKLLYAGIVGEDVTLEEAKHAAKVCVLNCLSGIRHVLGGDLNKVKRIIKVNGFVACTPKFREQAAVIDAVSGLLIDVFGQDGEHARAALGMSSLPGGSPVEVEIIAEFTQ